jgi:hypothetical protein
MVGDSRLRRVPRLSKTTSAGTRGFKDCGRHTLRAEIAQVDAAGDRGEMGRIGRQTAGSDKADR